MNIDKKYKFLRQLIAVTDGKIWIQGSFLNGCENTDIDIMVEREVWHIVTPIISQFKEVSLSTYGGFKINTDNTTYDIWCDSIERISRENALFTKAYNPRTKIWVLKSEDIDSFYNGQ